MIIWRLKIQTVRKKPEGNWARIEGARSKSTRSAFIKLPHTISHNCWFHHLTSFGALFDLAPSVLPQFLSGFLRTVCILNVHIIMIFVDFYRTLKSWKMRNTCKLDIYILSSSQTLTFISNELYSPYLRSLYIWE